MHDSRRFTIRATTFRIWDDTTITHLKNNRPTIKQHVRLEPFLFFLLLLALFREVHIFRDRELNSDGTDELRTGRIESCGVS